MPLSLAVVLLNCSVALMVLAFSEGNARSTAIQLVSVSSAGSLGSGDSGRSLPAITASGRFIAFQSSASNLVAGDTNNVDDVFMRDVQAGETERISVGSAGEEANDRSGFPSISSNGRHIAFESYASNLVAGDTNRVSDIFVRDRIKGTTEGVSVDNDGRQANGASAIPAISANGRYVAFYSKASNLVLRDTNERGDVFVHDRKTRVTERVNVDRYGNQANGDSYFYIALSETGRYIAFGSAASNLVEGDTNGAWDAFVHDRVTHTTERVSVNSEGNQGNSLTVAAPAISANGRYVAFASLSSNLVPADENATWDVFVHDRNTGITERVSVDSVGTQGNDVSGLPGMSGNGRYVVFASYASNLVNDDTNSASDIFVFDRLARTTIRISVNSIGDEGNGWSGTPVISKNGKYVAFGSDASNLADDDVNGFSDVLLRALRGARNGSAGDARLN